MAIANDTEYLATVQSIKTLEAYIDINQTVMRGEDVPEEEIKRSLDPATSFLEGLKEEAEAYSDKNPHLKP